jgi:hypothetical protein
MIYYLLQPDGITKIPVIIQEEDEKSIKVENIYAGPEFSRWIKKIDFVILGYNIIAQRYV